MVTHELAISGAYTFSVNEMVWQGIKHTQCSLYRKHSRSAKTCLTCFFNFALQLLGQCSKEVMAFYSVQPKSYPVIL